MEHNNFYIIPEELIFDNNISPGAILLLVLIKSLSKIKGYCWANNKYFCEHFSKSRSTIIRWIKELKDKEYIMVKLIKNDENNAVQKRFIYPLNKHKNSSFVPGVISDTTWCQICDDPGVRSDTDINITKALNTLTTVNEQNPVKTLADFRKSKIQQPKKSNYKICSEMINNFSKNKKLIAILNEYLRIRISKGLTPKQFKIIIDDLKKYSNTEEDMILKVTNAYAGSYNVIIPKWEKERYKNTFDNSINNNNKKRVSSMSTEEKEMWKNDLAKNEDGTEAIF